MKKLLLTILILSLLTAPIYASGNRWSSKPPIGSQIDWGHPLSKGLVFCALMNEGRGLQVLDLSPKKNKATLGNGIFKNNTIYLDGTGDYIQGSKLAGLSDNFTSLTCFFPVSVDALDQLLGDYDDTVGDEGWTIRSHAALWGFAQGGAGGFESLTSIMDVKLNTWQTVGCTKKGNDIKLYMFLPGYYSTFFQLTGTKTMVASQYKFTMGSSAKNTATKNINGYYKFCYLWNRVLSPQEIQTLYQDPYCFIQPPTIWSKFLTAVSGITNDVFGFMDGNATQDIFGVVD